MLNLLKKLFADTSKEKTETANFIDGNVDPIGAMFEWELRNNTDFEILDFSDDGFSIKYGEETATLYLDNIRLKTKNLDFDSVDIEISRHISNIKNSLSPVQLSYNLLFPVLRQIKYVIVNDELKNTLYYEPFIEDIGVFYVFDQGNTMRFATRDNLAGLISTATNIREMAIRNLLNSGRPSPTILKSENSEWAGIRLDGDYESSLILDQSTMEKIEKLMGGKLIVAIPNKDILLVALKTSKEARNEILTRTEKSYIDGAYPILPIALELDENNVWKKYTNIERNN